MPAATAAHVSRPTSRVNPNAVLAVVAVAQFMVVLDATIVNVALPTNLSRPEIAQELYVSPHTVNTHMRNIYLKLGVRDRSSAVQRARELRLLAAGRSRTSPR